MFSSLNTRLASMPLREDKLGTIRKHLAKSMIGSTVDLLADSQTIDHGIVTGVSMTAGKPKIIVNGRAYEMTQVVTATHLRPQ